MNEVGRRLITFANRLGKFPALNPQRPACAAILNHVTALPVAAGKPDSRFISWPEILEQLEAVRWKATGLCSKPPGTVLWISAGSFRESTEVAAVDFSPHQTVRDEKSQSAWLTALPEELSAGWFCKAHVGCWRAPRWTPGRVSVMGLRERRPVPTRAAF